jgi:glycosyltransferase involved in cell wall biosynthesis
MQKLAVIVPAFNESSVLEIFHARLGAVLAMLPLECTVLYVDDGSSDSTWDLIKSLRTDGVRVGGLRLSRNFGKEAALTAGLDKADADAVVVVYATRSVREGETHFKRFTAAMFYRGMERLSDTPIPRDTGDFRLLSRRALDALRQLRERQRFMKGLFAWIGYRQTAVRYQREPRKAGTTKWNYWRLTQLAIEGVTSFSTAPLRLATWVGLSSALLSFIYGLWVLTKSIVYGDPVRGYPTLMLVILFLGGVQLLALGVIGEYLGRNYAESKQRPLYFIDEDFHP